MDASALHAFKFTSGMIATLAGILAAWFEFRDRWQTKEDQRRTRASYRRVWLTIRQSGVLQLPEYAIAAFLRSISRLNAWMGSQFDSESRLVASTLLLASLFIGAYLCIGMPAQVPLRWRLVIGLAVFLVLRAGGMASRGRIAGSHAFSANMFYRDFVVREHPTHSRSLPSPLRGSSSYWGLSRGLAPPATDRRPSRALQPGATPKRWRGHA
jgi:hypothetical protein